MVALGELPLRAMLYLDNPVMDYRNINRYFGFTKALRQYNKSAPSLIPSEVMVLLTISHLSSCGIMAIYDHLVNFNRSMPLDKLTFVLRRFIDLGYLVRIGRFYSLTLSGKNVLSTIEDRCRNVRWDK